MQTEEIEQFFAVADKFGRAAIAGSRQIDLELKECRQLSKGCVLVTYKVKHA